MQSEQKPPIPLEDLTAYHRQKIIKRAGEWRLKNHSSVLALIKMDCLQKGSPPIGCAIFYPDRW